MDSATVVSVAITGAVGVAGVAGTVIAAKIAGKSAIESVRLSVSAENDRARLAEKRRIYAHALATFDAAMLAAQFARGTQGRSSGTPDETAASKSREAVDTAIGAMNELTLIAPRPVSDFAAKALSSLMAFNQGESDGDAMAEVWYSLANALRADLDEETGLGG